MTEAASHGKGASRAIKQHSSASRSSPWAHRAITLLGSTGIVSVLGPIVGELYWEGYLDAFGLTPHEFPASPARVSVFAYLAAMEALTHMWLPLNKNLWWIALLSAAATVVLGIFQHRNVRSKSAAVLDDIRSRLGAETLMAVVARAGVSGVLAGAATIVMFALALVTVSVALTPVLARDAGLREGEKQRAYLIAEMTATPSVCDSIKADGIGLCPRIVAYSDQTIAFLDDAKVQRLSRTGLSFSSMLPTANTARGDQASTPTRR